ncbi:MAG: cache domain-containing protein [Lachnospiraceae bacterium]|nr:cache domain-containing protein [Lachnospiraceae bacterium]
MGEDNKSTTEGTTENVTQSNPQKSIAGGTKGKKKFRFTLVWQVLFISLIPLLVLAIALTIVGSYSIKKGMQEEITDRLMASVSSLEGAIDALDDGDFTLDESNNLLKGKYNITANVAVLDSMVEGTTLDVTLFYDKTRRATTLIDHKTNERMIGTDASDVVYNQVVKEGKTLTAYDLVINDQQYYAFYKPMKDEDGSVVGMYFAGTPATDMNEYIKSRSMVLIGCALVVSILSICIVVVMAVRMRRAVSEANRAVTELADGNLRATINRRALERSDELGDMARGVKTLQSELLSTMSKVKESSQILLDAGRDLSFMASQTSSTADEIGHAVEDISRGAVSQAEEIETASSSIGEMGTVISRIVDTVGTLDETSEDMKYAGDHSLSIINDLSDSNDRTMEAIARIGKQVNATNESANRIGEAIEIITNIAEETNLLSLNASIEAARAGEQGRGFAVVANQIQKLAEQSNESAHEIAEIIKGLLNDSNHTVTVMNEVQEIVDEQQTKLEQTKAQFGDVSKGIDLSRDETNGIKGQTTLCNTARSKVEDIISNLSSISEQNAASTQQTTASMQELNATINLLAESAERLTELSEDLDGGIQFFRL